MRNTTRATEPNTSDERRVITSPRSPLDQSSPRSSMNQIDTGIAISVTKAAAGKLILFKLYHSVNPGDPFPAARGVPVKAELLTNKRNKAFLNGGTA